MSIKDCQRDVHNWTSQFTPQYWPIHEQLARLTEEVGELAREINHIHGTKKKKDSEDKKDLGSELHDVLFTLCCIANNSDIDLQEEWIKGMKEKEYGRDANRFDRTEDTQGSL